MGSLCNYPPTEHIIALFPISAQPPFSYSAYSIDHLSPVLPGGAGAPKPGQRWDQQAGAAAGCEKVVYVAMRMFVWAVTQHCSPQISECHGRAWWMWFGVFCCVCSLQDARSSYRRILTDSARKLNAQGSQLGACIEKARPYYEARRLAKEVRLPLQLHATLQCICTN